MLFPLFYLSLVYFFLHELSAVYNKRLLYIRPYEKTSKISKMCISSRATVIIIHLDFPFRNTFSVAFSPLNEKHARRRRREL